MNGAESTPSSDKRQAALQLVVEQLITAVAPSQRSIIRLAAIPHWADEPLLQRLSGEDANIAQVLEDLLDFQFAYRDSRGRLHYRDEVRNILLNWWRQNARQEYLEANRVALEYFRQLTASAPVEERQFVQRQVLYHTLVVDERAGLRLLNELLEEACYYRQLGAGEQCIAQAIQLREELSQQGLLWLRYFEACMDLVYRRPGLGKSAFIELAGQSIDPVLRALANWKLGQVRVSKQRWSKARELYKKSLNDLQGADLTNYRGRVMMSLGDAYCDLADRSGGFFYGPGESYGIFNSLLNLLLNFPFLILEWLMHRISFLPSWYFGTSYQDWIIAYLLSVASGWVRRADRLFAAKENPLEQTEARLSLAGLEHQLGRWSRARRIYANLEITPVIRQSQYRMAKVQLGEGISYLREGNLSRTVLPLTSAAETFHSFQDEASYATASFWLGKTYEQQKNPSEAAKAYMESAKAYSAVADQLALTRSIWNLERLVQRFSLPEKLQAEIDALLTKTPRRHTLSRFPQRILRLYRRLALLVAIPLTYGLMFIIGTVLSLVLAFFETTLLSASQGVQLPVIALLSVLGRLVVPLLLAFWIYRFVYSLLGLIVVRVLGHRLDPIQHEQADHLVVEASGIARYSDLPSTTAQAKIELTWSEVTNFVSVDYKFLQRPIHLISRSLLLDHEKPLRVEGTTSGYERLKSHIQGTLISLPEPSKILNRDFTFVEGRWLPTAILVSLGIIAYLTAIGQIELTGLFETEMANEGEIVLPFSTMIAYTIPTMLLVLPAVWLWRVLTHRVRLEKEFGYRGVSVSTSLLRLGAILSTIFALGWVLLLAFMP